MENGKSVEDKELTTGEKAVGLTFNPSGDETVIKAKKISAELIDMLEVKMKELENNSVEKVSKLSWVSWTANVLHMAAFNAVIAAQMAVVKFLTWKD